MISRARRRRPGARRLAGTPAIAPWARAGRSAGSGHSTWRATSSTRRARRRRTRPPARRWRARRRRRRRWRRSRSASSGARRRTVTSARRRQRRGVERGRIRDDAQPAQRLKHGHGGPPGRRTASASRPPRGRRSRPRSGNGVRRSQPSISGLAEQRGVTSCPVTLPTTSPPDQIGAALDRGRAVHREAEPAPVVGRAWRSARATRGR